MAAATPFADIPYLASVTVLQPKGNLAAEVAAHYSRRWGILDAPISFPTTSARCKPIRPTPMPIP